MFIFTQKFILLRFDQNSGEYIFNDDKKDQLNFIDFPQFYDHCDLKRTYEKARIDQPQLKKQNETLNYIVSKNDFIKNADLFHEDGSMPKDKVVQLAKDFH